MAQSTKIKASGRMALCHMNARARGFLGLSDPQQEAELVGKCSAKLGTAFLKAEAKCQGQGAPDCVTNDAATVAPRIQTLGDRLEAFLAQEAVPAQRYVDNGDGTMTDNQTGLQWEKKTDDAGVHDKDHTYTWSATSGGTTPNGTVFTAFLNQLNNCTTNDGSAVTGGFAGHCDWRLPSILELQGIVDLTAGSPTIDPIFGPTVANIYWSATSNATTPTAAWWVSFGNGWVFNFYKDGTYYVRAVRGGW